MKFVVIDVGVGVGVRVGGMGVRVAVGGTGVEVIVGGTGVFVGMGVVVGDKGVGVDVGGTGVGDGGTVQPQRSMPSTIMLTIDLSRHISGFISVSFLLTRHATAG